MRLEILGIEYHRNGIDGAPFNVVLFDDGESKKVAVLFEARHYCAVLDADKLAAADIAPGSNSWRGDQFERSLRFAINVHQMRTEANHTPISDVQGEKRD